MHRVPQRDAVACNEEDSQATEDKMSLIPNLTTFDELLPHLQEGRLDAIEYGDPKQPGGYLSYMRIRYIATPAGMQYCIKFLRAGMEGSGIYFPGRMQLRDHVMCYIDRYHQAGLKYTGDKFGELLKQKLLTRRDTLQFFSIMPNKEDK